MDCQATFKNHCTYPKCDCDLHHPDLANDGTPEICPLKYDDNKREE